MNGILADFEDNQSFGLEKRNPAAFGWSLGAVFVVMAFCSLIVGIDAWRISLYDEETLDKLMMHLHHCNNTLLLHLPKPETIYQMAQRKCEDIRQRFRSRSGTPVKASVAPEPAMALPTPESCKREEEDEVMFLWSVEGTHVEAIYEEGKEEEKGNLTRLRKEKEDLEVVSEKDLINSMEGTRNRGQKMASFEEPF